jgi:hypothetical protein
MGAAITAVKAIYQKYIPSISIRCRRSRAARSMSVWAAGQSWSGRGRIS